MAEQVTQNPKKIALTITTPRGIKFEEEADMVNFRAIDGDMGVLPGHAKVSVVLGDGTFRIKNDGQEKLLAVFGGIADIGDNQVNIFTQLAQEPEEIDLERAEADRKRAEHALAHPEADDLVYQQCQVAIRRALVRIEVKQDEEN